MKLQQEVKEKEAKLEQCYLRMERGEPPNEEMEAEWHKLVRQELQRAKEKENQKLVIDLLPRFIGSKINMKNIWFQSVFVYCYT